MIKRLTPNDSHLAIQLISRFKSKKPSQTYLKNFLKNPHNYLLIAENDGKPVGFLLAYTMQRIDQDAIMIYIHEIEVTKEHRRKGVGKNLIEKLQHEAAQEKAVKSFVITNSSNLAACKLYESTGAKRPNQDDVVFIYKT